MRRDCDTCYMVEERVSLVDARGRLIGSDLKRSVHSSDTPLHLGFSLFLFDSHGRTLMQRRSEAKPTWGGVWSNSCCGHPAPGESFAAAIERRLKFELGLSGIRPILALPDFRYRAHWRGIWENEVCPVFVGACHGDPAPHPDEVSAVSWIDWQSFAEASRNPEGTPFAEYTPWSLLEADKLRRSPVLSNLLEGSRRR